jgi:nicotinamidase-related amidase
MRIKTEQTMALVVDIQERLFPHMNQKDILLENCVKLAKGLKLLNIQFILNEQYPKGIGTTIAPIKKLIPRNKVFEKFTFSCCKTTPTKDAIEKIDKKFIIVFGIEAHVCVLQSVLDLIELGYTPVVVSDCVSSRKQNDKEVALLRMSQSGAIITTYESLLFELCVSSKNEAFKEISKLIK